MRDYILTNCRNIPNVYAVENGVKTIKSAICSMVAAEKSANFPAFPKINKIYLWKSKRQKCQTAPIYEKRHTQLA
jgi:hypothetical protein